MSGPYRDSPQWRAYERLMKERPDDFAPSEEMMIVTDAAAVERFVEETGTVIGVCYQSAFHILVVDLIRSPNGVSFAYERILPAVPSDGVVAMTVQDDRFVLLRQFRHALREEQYGFPRGFGEPGLAPEENARREIMEELGAETVSIQYLGRVAADSGLADKYACVYLCGITGAKTLRGYEGIDGVVHLSERELEEWIGAGRITDGFTLSAYSLYRCKMKTEDGP